MAGQPLKRQCHALLDENEEEIFNRLSAGEFVTSLCKEYLAPAYEDREKDEAPNHWFYSWLDAAEGRRERFDRVRESAADAMAEESVRILDEAREQGVDSTAEATLARSQSSSRQWLASKYNRPRYGEGPGVQVNVASLGDLHLDALQKHGRMTPADEPEQIEEAEYEELEAGESYPDEWRDDS